MSLSGTGLREWNEFKNIAPAGVCPQPRKNTNSVHKSMFLLKKSHNFQQIRSNIYFWALSTNLDFEIRSTTILELPHSDRCIAIQRCISYVRSRINPFCNPAIAHFQHVGCEKLTFSIMNCKNNVARCLLRHIHGAPSLMADAHPGGGQDLQAADFSTDATRGVLQVFFPEVCSFWILVHRVQPVYKSQRNIIFDITIMRFNVFSFASKQ